MTTHYRETVSDQIKGSEYVLSDGSLDRHGTRINPAGWDLSHFRNNPKCLFVHGRDPKLGQRPLGHWHDVRVEGDRLVGRLEWVPKGTVKEVDEIHALADLGFLKATSVGFEPSKFGDARKGEFDYVEQQLLEASIVSIGSNPNALMKARSLGISERILSAVFDGEHAEIETRDGTATGEHAATPPSKVMKMDRLPMSKRIENAQTELNAARDAYQAHVADEDFDTDKATTFKSEVDRCAVKLDSLKDAERTLSLRTAELEGDDESREVAVKPERRPLGVRSREVEPRELLVRAGLVQLLSFMQRVPFEQVLEQRYPDHKATHEYTRAAVAAATTTAAGWAAELMVTGMTDFLAHLDPDSVFPRVAAAGVQLSFGPNAGAIKIPSRATTPSIGGSFVAEGAPIPVRRLGLTSITLLPNKIGVISAFSREIMRYSNPQIEGIVREAMREDTAIMMDGLLLDAVGPASATRPAGLLYGLSTLTASAASTAYARILADLTTLSSPFYAVNAGRRLVLLINKANALQLSMAPGPDGTFGWTDQFTSRFQVIESTSIPANKVIMLDAADFVSVLGTPEFEVSEHATLHMEDTTPLPIGTAGTPNVVAAPVSSMFQEAKIALRMLMDATWAMRRTGMVQFINTVNWAPP
jgi:HK97 family phage major capsid protein